MNLLTTDYWEHQSTSQEHKIKCWQLNSVQLHNNNYLFALYIKFSYNTYLPYLHTSITSPRHLVCLDKACHDRLTIIDPVSLIYLSQSSLWSEKFLLKQHHPHCCAFPTHGFHFHHRLKFQYLLFQTLTSARQTKEGAPIPVKIPKDLITVNVVLDSNSLMTKWHAKTSVWTTDALNSVKKIVTAMLSALVILGTDSMNLTTKNVKVRFFSLLDKYCWSG